MTQQTDKLAQELITAITERTQVMFRRANHNVDPAMLDRLTLVYLTDYLQSLVNNNSDMAQSVAERIDIITKDTEQLKQRAMA